MATGSPAGPAQRLSQEDKPAASQTDLPSWVSEWRDCSLGTITRREVNLLGKFLSGAQWKREQGERRRRKVGIALWPFSLRGCEGILSVLED